MKKYLIAGLAALLAVILAIFLVKTAQRHRQENKEPSIEQETKEQILKAGLEIFQDMEPTDIENIYDDSGIYTFLQGPRSWEEGVPWSGEWCYSYANGNVFGSFGCGFCCMANIYDTLSPYEVSPWDICEYTMEISGYEPTRKSGALDWGNMKEMLKKCGFPCDVYYKVDTYEEFQGQMTEAASAVVLVCSADDDSFWTDTPGHYVNIWQYNPEDDTVFLAEPGSPENNRTRIPLRYVYDAMKTTSKFQYLLVEEYVEENNQWKADGIDESWNRPDELSK